MLILNKIIWSYTDLQKNAWKIYFRIQHDFKMLDSFKEMEKKEILIYCNGFDAYSIFPHFYDQEDNQANKIITPDMTIYEESVLNLPSKNYIPVQCQCATFKAESVAKKIEKLGGLIIYPIKYQHSWEYYKILCSSDKIKENVLSFLESSRNFEIIESKNIDNSSLTLQLHMMSELMTRLTDTQIGVLKKAFRQGYYQIPRKIRLQDIAQDMHISRQSVEKTLRKAENKLISALIPFLFFQEQEEK